MSGSHIYNWQQQGNRPPSELEEGEISDELPSSDEDFSPASLVIDTQGQAGSSSNMSSAPPTPPIEMLQHTLGLDTHPIFTTIPAPSPPPTTYSTSSFPLNLPPLLPTFATPTDEHLPTPSQDLPPLPLFPSHVPDSILVSEEDGPEVKFVVKIEVSAKGSAPVDLLCIYKFRWDHEYIEVLTRQKCPPLIPVKNLYLKAIPGLKQNVLSARISKLGIRSLVLSEPYISTVKKLNLGLTGSSHYVTISDFVKICTYFKRKAPALVGKFDFVSSDLDPQDVLHLFNDPDTSTSKNLLSQLSEEMGRRASQMVAVPGVDAGTKVRRGSNFNRRSDGSNPDGSFNLAEVDARQVVLPNGHFLYVIVKEGMALLPNPELAKILPAVSRTAMEHIRNSYGISVEQATKTDMAMLKHLGVVSVKAGRTLLYKAVDVVTMFRHWKTNVPNFVNDMAMGKIPEKRVVVSLANYQGSSPSTSSQRTASPLTHSSYAHSPSLPPTSHPLHHINTKQDHNQSTFGHTSSNLSRAQFVVDGIQSHPSNSTSSFGAQLSLVGGMGTMGTLSQGRGLRKVGVAFSSGGVEQIDVSSREKVGPVGRVSSIGGSGQLSKASSSEIMRQVGVTSLVGSAGKMGVASRPESSTHGELLMPETFQLPVEMLNSFSTGRSSVTNSTSGSSTSSASNFNPVDQHQLDYVPSRLLEEVTMRRKVGSRAASNGPLDDQTLEYSPIIWGDETLTLLTPEVGAEGYLAIPELVHKVFKSRSHVSSELRMRLGIHILPASALQILALRSRGSVEATAGNIKLLALSDAVRLAVAGGFHIPGPVIHTLKNSCPVSIQEILSPAVPAETSVPVVMPPSSMPGPTSTSHHQADIPSVTVTIPVHPAIIPIPSDWRLAGAMYEVKWSDASIIIYISNLGNECVSLYQIYEALFKRYVTRVNFKMRMRKLDIRSERAPSSVRLKLVELGALPSNCPVCGLISVQQFVRLAKSYGLEPPPVLYEVFLSSILQQRQQILSENPVASPDPFPLEPSRTSTPPYGIVPYLTSSHDNRSEDSTDTLTAPNLIMTSLGTKATNQIHLSGSETDDSNALIVSIQRRYTPFKLPLSDYAGVSNPGSSKPHPQSNLVGNLGYSGSRGKLLQNLAKKISQKSKRYTNTVNSIRSTNQSAVKPNNAAPITTTSSDVPGGTRTCPSCKHVNPKHKKRCGVCYEFIVGVQCPSCSVLNYYRAKNCFRCGTNMPSGWCSVQPAPEEKGLKEASSGVVVSHGQVLGGRGTLEGGSSHPTSPSRFTAPPIRSAVLKSLFPQDAMSANKTSSEGNHSHHKTEGGGHASILSGKSIVGGGGGVTSTRKCLECDYLNTRMAKKCIRCKGHLQGRPCTRCGRPNLNHVMECYKCGASLPPSASTSSKYVYGGSHSRRVYQTEATTATVETKILLSRAPITCIRCNKIRCSGYLKCGRCGDAFRAQPLVTHAWEGGASQDLPPPAKRSRESLCESSSERVQSVEPSVLSGLACNILELGLHKHLTPLIKAIEEESKQLLNAKQEELEAADLAYQSVVGKKKEAERRFLDEQASLDALILQMESTSKMLEGVVKDDEVKAKSEIEELPLAIVCLKAKIDANRLLSSPENDT